MKTKRTTYSNDGVTSQTSAQAATEQRNRVIERLRSMLEGVEKIDTNTTNWGIAGSLQHVATDLDELAAHLAPIFAKF